MSHISTSSQPAPAASTADIPWPHECSRRSKRVGGAVQIAVTGKPAAMGLCHCESCRHWSAAPANAFTLWRPEAVRVTRGGDLVASYSKTPNSNRKWCKACGGHLFTQHPPLGLIDVYAAVIPDFPYQPGVHVNYQETRLRVRDGLPKMKDLPKEMGGSGVALAE